MPNKIQNLAGLRFGLLTVVGGRVVDSRGNASWECACDCGNSTTVRMSSLKSGVTKSCGCLVKECAAEKGRNSKKHSLSTTPEYQVWKAMMDRCYNESHPAYKHYGQRGILVAEEWHSLERFIEDMGNRPTNKHQIDRIDNSKGYSKDNCRWATIKQNQRNKRDNVTVLLNGLEVTVAEAAEITGLNYTTIHYRQNKGLTQETGLFDKPSK